MRSLRLFSLLAFLSTPAVAAVALPVLALMCTPAVAAVTLPVAARPGDVWLDGGWLGPNLLGNPSMEEGDGDGPAGWKFAGEGRGIWDREEASHGRRSLAIHGRGEWRSARFPLQPGVVTLMAADTLLRGSGRWGGAMRVDFQDASGTRIGKLDPYLRDEHGWWNLRWAGIAPEGTVSASVSCYTFRDQAVKAWCDAVEVRQWRDAEPLADGPRALPAAIVGLDFGPEHSKTQPGYHRMGPGSDYRADVGHGWTSSVRLEGRDQTGDLYRPAELDKRGEPVDRERTLLDALTRDAVRGVGFARLQVDVPPGRYRVFLLGGHARIGESPPYFELIVTAGSQVAGRLSKRHPDVSFGWLDFETEVGEGGLRLGLASDRFGGAWSVSALLVIPEDSAAEGEVAVAAVRRSLEFLPSDLLARLRRLPASWALLRGRPAGTVPPAKLRGEGELRRGVWPGVWPRRRLAGAASPGLSVDLPFVIRAGAPLRALTVQVEGSDESARNFLQASTVSYVEERALRYTQGYVSHDVFKVQPDALRREIPSNLPAATDHFFWLRVRVPPGQEPGTYRGALRWTHADGGGSVSLAVDVLPYVADELELFQNVYYQGSSGRLRTQPSIGVEEVAAELRARDLADIEDHLGSAAALLRRIPPIRRADGSWGVETAFLQEQLEDFRRAGRPARDALVLLQPMLRALARAMVPEQAGKLGKHVSGSPQLPEEYWAVFGSLVEELDAELREQGVERRLYNPWDEAFGEDLDLFAQVASVLRERLEEPRIFCNGYSSVYYGLLDTGPERALAPHCNAWWTYGTLTDEQRQAEMDRGTWLFGSFVPEGPAAARAAAGLLRWRRQEMGGHWWAYDAYRGSVNTQLDGPSYGDRCLVYPGATPAPRLAWEATRVGVEDLRYLRTLERKVQESLDDPRREVRRVARRGQAWLRDLWESLDPALPDPLGGYSAYEEMRLQGQKLTRKLVRAASGA